MKFFTTKTDYKKTAFAFLAVLFFAITGFSQTQQVTITQTGAGSFTVPCGVNTITVQAWGGGGAGGGSTASTIKGGGGGAGGAYVSSILTVSPGTTYNLSVGAGANGTTSAGAVGGASWFNTASILNAPGGAGGAAPNGGTVAGGVGSITGAIGTTKTAGQSGDNGTSTTGGGGGDGGNAAGTGAGTRTTSASGRNGSQPGGGGGGAFVGNSTDQSGGDGGDGEIIITYSGYCVPSFNNISAINNVTLTGAGINNNSVSTTADYETFCSITGNVVQGSTYPISVTGTTSGGSTTYYMAVYIDWNQDGDFSDPNETYLVGNSSGGTITGSIAVPSGASLGTTVMRVMFQRSGTYPTSCAAGTGRGQAEDYSLNVTSSASIATGTISPLSYCAGVSSASVPVPFTSTGTYGAGNVYTAQLSNSSGSFGTPITLGTLNSTASGTLSISGTILAGTAAGSGYRIRVVSSNPSVTGGDNGSNITINNPAAPTGTSPQTFCASANTTVANLTTATGTNIQWYAASSGGSPLASTTPLVNGTHYYASQTVSGCEGSARLDVTTTITAAPNTTFTYSTYTYCATGTSPAAILSGSPQTGTFSASPAGLNFISTSTGQINLATSAAGTYAITYTVAAAGGCGIYTYSQPTNVFIQITPSLFSVTGGGAYCSTGTGSPVGLSGSESGVNYQLFRGATPIGSAVAGTGASLDFGFQTVAGTYTVIGDNGTCTNTMTGNAVISITTAPNTTFTYPTYTYCKTGTSLAATLSGSPQTGTFSASPAGLNFVSTSTGQINLATSAAGTYTITYTVAASGSCGIYTYSQPTNVVINALPTAFSVTGTGTYCSSAPGSVGLSGSESGVNYQLYRGATAIGSAVAGTGTALDFGPQGTAGTYTVVSTNLTTTCTNNMTGSAVINITTAPNTTFTYTTYTYCKTGTSGNATLSGSPTSGSFSASPAGLNFVSTSTGQINLATSAAGTYTITYTVAALGGCGIYTYSQPTNVVINALPTAFSVTGTGTYCSSAPGSVGLSGSESGVNYQLYRAATAIGTAVAGTGIALDFGPQGTAGTYTVVATNPTTTCTNNMTGSAVINITSAPNTTFTYTTYTYCRTGTSGDANLSGSPQTGIFSASPAGLNFVSTSNGQINLATSAAGTYTITYTVAASGGCSIYTYSQPTNVVINAVPTASAGADIVSCSVPILMTGATATGTYTSVAWSGGPGLGTFSGSGTDPSTYIFTPSVPQGSFTATLTVTGAAPCNGNNPTSTRKITWGFNGSWLGITNTNWFDATNWCGGVPTATTDVTIPAVGSVPNQPSIGATGAVCHSIAINGTLITTGTNNLDVYGDWTNNGTFTPGTGSITFRGSSNNTLAGSNATTFSNLIVNKDATANTVTSTTKAFTSTNLTVTQGDLILQATNANYIVTGDITVPVAGILTHSANWDTYSVLLSVGGNIAIDGIFNYTTRSHVQMYGSGKTVYTGTKTGSAFSILTLISTGNVAAGGTLTINDNFWAMFGSTGSFSTGTNTVTANAALLNSGGTVNVNGGILNVTGGISVSAGNAGVLTFSSGTINADGISVGTATTGTFTHTAGTANINGDLTITANGTYTCGTGSPVINIKGNWTNNLTFTCGTTSQVNFNGTTTQTIGGSVATIFNNLNIANAAGVTLSMSATVNTTLGLTNGLITTGGNILTVATAGTITPVSGSASSYVNGKLARAFATGAGAKVFPIGKGGNYRPLTFTYGNSTVATTITAEQFESALTGTITPATTNLYAARYWEITKTGTGTFNYTVTLDPTGFTPSGIVKMVKKDGAGTALNAYDITTPNYTNATAFTTFNNTSSGTNDFALASDCSSSANAGAALATICQGGMSVSLGGSVSGTATGGTWSDGGVGGTFNSGATNLNTTWTPPAGYSGTATLTLTPTGGVCSPATASSKTQVVNASPVISGTGQPANQTTCAGTAKTFTVTLSAGTSPSYQWQYSANGTTGWGNVINNTPANTTYGGGTSATLTATPSAAAAAGTNYYRCIVTVGACSTPATSNSATLTVNISSTISLISAATTNAQTICQNTLLTDIVYQIGGGGTGASITSGALPAGVTGVYDAGTKRFTISGTPTTAIGSPFNYTVTTTGPCTQANASGSITVIAGPTGSVTVTENSGISNTDNTICAGDNITFTAPNPNNSYTWYVNGTKVQGPSTDYTYSTTALPNNATVTVDVANGNSCGYTFTAPAIIVKALPVPTLTIHETSGTTDDKSICPNAPVTYNATGGTNYSYLINGSVVATNTTGTYTTTAIATTSTVSVLVSNSDGCQATTVNQTITVNPVPSGTLTANPGNTMSTTICAGTSVTFTATAVAGNIYDFRVNNVSVRPPDGTNTYSTNTLANGDVVTIVVTNASGCSATLNSISVNVNPLPAGTLSATENSGMPNDYSICTGSSVKFIFSTAGYSNYNFKINGVSKQSNNSNSFITTALAAGDNVTVDITNGSCSATFTAPPVTIVPSPSGTLTATENSGLAPNDNVICAGDPVMFTASSDPSFTKYNFKINNVTAQVGTGNTFNPTSLSDGDIVSVDVTNSNGCISTFNTIIMVVNPLPSGTLDISENSGTTPNDGIICEGASVTFTAPIGFSNYNFLINGSSVQNGATRTYGPISSLANGDKVTVAVTGTGGCIGLLNEYTITVNLLPSVQPITGNLNVCESGGTTTLSDGTTGGTWTSEDPTKATVNASTGVVTGVAPGTATIDYTFTNTNGCSTTVTKTVTVHALPGVEPITGDFNLCTSTSDFTSTSQLSDLTAGGVWSSNNPSVATIDINGLVTAGMNPGNATISYAFTDIYECTTVVTADIIVSSTPMVAPISTTSPAGFNVCGNRGTLQLNDATPQGIWSSLDPSIADVNSTGLVTGYTAGTTTISYNITTSCGDMIAAKQDVTVNAPPFAAISYTGNPFCTTTGPVAVTFSGTTGGTYSYTSSGTLSLAADGTIDPSASTPGTYTIIYKIPASATGGCGDYNTTTQVTITANPTITSFSYDGSPYCSTITSASPTLVASSTSGTYTSTAGLTISSTNGVINPSTSTAGTYTVTYSIPVSGGCSIVSKTTSVAITANPTITSFSYSGTPYCSTVTSASPTLVASSTSGTYSSTTGLTLNSSTGVINPSTSTPGTYTVTYTISAALGCSIVSKTTPVVITTAPTAIAGDPVKTCSNSPAVNITAGSSATNYSSIVWTTSDGTGNFANANSLTTATYTPTAADIAAGSITLVLTANGTGGCSLSPAISTKTLTISAPPPAFVLTPSNPPPICQGTVQSLTATANTTTTGSMTFSSTSNNNAIPDQGSIGNNVTVSIPAGAIINSVSVTFKVTHGYDNDLIFNLKAPNGKVLNLVNQDGADGNNYNNTVINSTVVNPINAGTAAFTAGPYSSDAANNVGGPTASNVAAFSSLYTIPNGTWTFEAADVVGCHGGALACFFGLGTYYTGTLNNWSITINYTIPNSPLLVTWSPTTDLYTDAGATTVYTGTSLSTVYAKPATSGTKTYTATAINGAGCSTAQTVTLNVNPTPVVTIAADYCSVPGKVLLTATSVPAATSYIWSTGSTHDTTQVDEAGNYTVTAITGATCPGTATINVANELVTNGNFEAGNVGFTTAYAYSNSTPNCSAGTGGLYPENTYNVTNNPQSTHCNFWGNDHTTGSGNFMLVNGSGTSSKVWQETVNVLPNTNYYFSAWAMSLNNAGNYAKLQFSVNGVLVGTTATLAAHAQNNNPSSDNWIRFYGTWPSGATTTSAVITIVDQQTAPDGNDFGLDDVSFSTLSTFVNLVSGPGTDAQTVCVNAPIQNIVYSAGSSASEPTVTGLPPGVTHSFNGIYETISGTPTVAGNYSYTVTTTGSCQPASATGTITVQSQKITLSSGEASPTVCVNTPVNIGYTLSGTATGATETGLVSNGFTFNVTGTSVIIGGTPTAAGTYPYTITTTPATGSCDPVSVSGTITVTAQTIILNTGNDNQTVCINSPITNILYTIGGTATGAGVTGLPPGVTGSYNGGFFTIIGSPSDATNSPYTYKITTTPATGSCDPVSIQGKITVTPSATFTLTSDPSTNPETVCKGAPIIPITYAITNATDASITGQPTGVTGSASGGVFTITGTPTAPAGTYTYTIKNLDGCGVGSTTGTIIVQAQTISLDGGSRSPSVCNNMPMANIVFKIGGTATGATVSGQPNGVTGTLSGNLFTINGTPNDAVGQYHYTVTTLPATGACDPVTDTGTITITAAAIGGNLTSPPTAACSGGSGTLTLQNQVGTIVRWESSTDNFNTITAIPNTTISLNYSNIIVPTQFRVVVSNTCGNGYSTVATVGVQNYWVGLGMTDDWSDPANWSGNKVADLTCPMVTIPAGTPHNPVIYDGTNAVANSIFIYNDASLTMNGTGNLTISSNGTITNNGAFTENAGAGIVTFNGGGTINGANAGSFNNLTMNGDLALLAAPAITGNFKINSGQVSGIPTYGNNSTLIYNTTTSTYNVGTEWTGNSTTAGSGIPQNVTIQNTNNVLMPAMDRGLAGNLTISVGSKFSLSTTNAKNLYIGGNWINNGTFIHNMRAVTFDGGIGETIMGNTTFYDLTENQASGANLVFVASHTTIDHNLTITKGTMTPNPNTLVEFTGMGNLAGANAKAFYDLQIDNTSAMTITSGTVSIAHNFVNDGTYTYSVAPRQTTFSGSGGIVQSMSGMAGSSTIFGTVVVGDNHPLSTGIILNATNDYVVQGGSLSLSHSSTLNNTGNTVTFSVSPATVSTTGAGTAKFNNATANVSVDFGSGISTIYGNLTLNDGGFINNVTNNVPVYSGTASTLTYNKTATTVNPALEWNVNSSAEGPGAPYNVSVTNTNSVQLLSDRTIPGILTLTNGSLDIHDDSLTVAGGFSGTGGYLIGSIKSRLVAGGSGIIHFAANDWDNNKTTNNYLKRFIINSSADLSIGDSLNIATGTFDDPGTITTSGILQTYDNTHINSGVLTIKSDVNGDARVTESYGAIKGNVVVERYIPPRRAWRFITAPVNSSQTINAAWQEGVYPGNPDIYTHINPNPGFGTEITYDNNPVEGYDVNTQSNPSIRYWSPAANDFLPLPSGTISTNINAFPAYYLFVRGSRDIDLSQAIYAPPDPTVLRAKGSLSETGAGSNKVMLPSVAQPNQYFFVGNPYASPVNLTNIINGSRSNGYIHNQFWVWDPNLSGSLGVGAYVAYSGYDNGVGVWAPSDGETGGTYPYSNAPIIQSGQAFLMKLDGTSSSASLEFQQADKNLASEAGVFGKQEMQQRPPVFYTNLMAPLGDSLILMDGVAAAFGEGNSPGIDKKDASKKWNTQESIGLFRNNTWQAIEFRPIPLLTDTLFYAIYYLNQRSYTLKVIAKDVPPGFPQAWLIDKYLNTRTTLDVNTPLLYSFTANGDVKSYQNRFMLVFKRAFVATPVPVTKVINQINPGTTGNANSMAGTVSGVSVHPNPVATGEKVMLQFSSMSKGKYQVTVTNTEGKALAEKTVEHDGGSSIYSLQTDARWAAGSYFVKITGEDGYSSITKLVISK